MAFSFQVRSNQQNKEAAMTNSPWWADQRFGSYNDTLNEGLSILDLVNSGTVDCKLAALLWIIMEQGASVIVASAPIYAGKTTLLHALLDFVPRDVHKIALKGYYEDFKFLDHGQPKKTYMVAEEISNHGFFEYLWGLKAVRTFKLLSQGYALGATMHARTSEEVLLILHRVLGISVDQLARMGIIVNLRATAGLKEDDDPIRRVMSVDLVLPHQEGLAIQVLAARQYTENGFDYQSESSLQQVLAGKNLIGKYSVNAEIEARKRFLRHLLQKGRTARQEVRNAVWQYNSPKPD
jgi:hypothetical protein